MKFVENLIMCRGFAICRGHMTSDEVYTFTSSNTSTDGIFSQLLFGVSGAGDVIDSEGNIEIELRIPKTIYDLKQFYNKDFTIKAHENGGTWICINPIPANKVYSGEVLEENTNIIISGTNKEQVVLCIDGEIQINDKILTQFQYSRILKDSKASVKVNSDSIGMYFYTE